MQRIEWHWGFACALTSYLATGCGHRATPASSSEETAGSSPSALESPAWLAAGEHLGADYYRLTFADATGGPDTDSLAGTGVIPVGAAWPPATNLRFHGKHNWPPDGPLEGGIIGPQQYGIYDIVYKMVWPGGPGGDTVSLLIPNEVPRAFGAGRMPDGSSFDGSALWLGHSRFLPGQAPGVGTVSPPATGTRWDGSVGPADFGADVRVDASHLVDVPVVTGVATAKSFRIAAHVYVPLHGPPQLSTTANHKLGAQPYLERDAYGLTVPGGIGHRQIEFGVTLPDGGGVSWSRFELLEVRVDITTHGGTLASSSDDSGQVTYRYYLHGTQVGAADTIVLDSNVMASHGGPVRLSPSFSLWSGAQGYAAEAFVDNLSIAPILPN